ncbi:MAG: TVP38/TMEM64 family protein [Woeseiaceae bacterium]|nr:TVP38/TMEM64 family protein [Woeseiaceae bacterium]
MSIGKQVAFTAVILVLATSLYHLPLANWITVLVAWGQHHPVTGPLVYVIFIVIATVLFLPGSVAMMIGGFLFGLVPGLVLAAFAIPIGAQSSFEFGRWIARPWVQKRMANNHRMHAIEAALADQAFVIVILTRLSLIIPFNLLNYAYGASSVKASTHFFATALGMLPAVALYVYLGTLARDLGQILSGAAAPSELGYWIFGAGIVAIVLATWVIHRTATRALEKHLMGMQRPERTE